MTPALPTPRRLGRASFGFAGDHGSQALAGRKSFVRRPTRSPWSLRDPRLAHPADSTGAAPPVCGAGDPRALLEVAMALVQEKLGDDAAIGTKPRAVGGGHAPHAQRAHLARSNSRPRHPVLALSKPNRKCSTRSKGSYRWPAKLDDDVDAAGPSRWRRSSQVYSAVRYWRSVDGFEEAVLRGWHEKDAHEQVERPDREPSTKPKPVCRLSRAGRSGKRPLATTWNALVLPSRGFKAVECELFGVNLPPSNSASYCKCASVGL